MERLYQDLAYLFPLITPAEEYAQEARHWRAVLREKLGPGRHRVLELGVGGGHNLSHLTADLDATAVDLSEAMLDLSRSLNPAVEHIAGDMRSVRLGRTFAAVLIHDAISYMTSEEDLRATIATAFAHLDGGGVLIMAPDHYRETFPGTTVEHRVVRTGSTEITFIEHTHDPDPTDTVIESTMFFLICEQGRLRIEQDHHLLGLFPLATWAALLEHAGFVAERRPVTLSNLQNPYWLQVGTRRAGGGTGG